MGLIEMNSNPGDNFNRHLRNIEEEVDGFTVTKLYFLGCEDPEKFLVEILFERLSVECGPFIIIKPDLYDLKDESLAGACFLDQVVSSIAFFRPPKSSILEGVKLIATDQNDKEGPESTFFLLPGL